MTLTLLDFLLTLVIMIVVAVPAAAFGMYVGTKIFEIFEYFEDRY